MSEENPNTPVDEESAKLLAEFEEQNKPKAPAPKRRSAAAKPASVVAEKPAPVVAETPAPVVKAETPTRTIKNVSKNPRRIGGVTVPVGGTYDLTDHDLEDESLMAKIEHSLQTGVLSRGDN